MKTPAITPNLDSAVFVAVQDHVNIRAHDR